MFLRKKFPGRIKVFYGDSSDSIPVYFTLNQRLPTLRCDMIVVNGKHTDSPLNDIRNFARAASQPYNIIVVDDMYMENVRTAWSAAVRDGIVRKMLTCEFWAMGVVIQRNNLYKQFINYNVENDDYHV